ncbi:MAG: MBL fold metallo-hydrolase [Clostridium sp.]|nr:MBL fold metallo-hydrolase [Clostridium sp.]
MKFCSLYSGSSGNSIFVGSEKAKILIDAGLPGKKIDEALKHIGQNPSEIDGIFITHEHIDHIKGVGVLSRKYDIPIYAPHDTWVAMENIIGKIKEHNIKVMDRRSTISIKDIDVKSFIIPHDAASPVGYTINLGDKRASIATDFGTFTKEIEDNIKDSEIILIESNYNPQMLDMGPYPYSLKQRIKEAYGHLSNEDCGDAIVKILKNGLGKKIILGHLSNTNNTPDLAELTVKDILTANNIEVGSDVFLSLANRHNPSNIFNL